MTGMWYANDQWFGNEHDRMAMDFINSNTLIWYGTVSTNKNAFQNMEGVSLDGCAGWYYFGKTYYTYVLTDNKIFFNDRIFTIFEDYLVEDGSSWQWKPWDNGSGGGEAPTTVSVATYNPTDITSTEAVCGAEVVGNGSNIRELGICWGTSACPTVENSHLSTTTWNTPFVCTISDLTPDTRYHVRAYALNGTTFVYGDDKSFTTLPEGGGGGQTYTITATANPSNGGMLIGSGTYQEGQQCTLIATANSGYDFVNWTEDGTEVSLDLNYTFAVNANRTLLANFISSGSGNAPEGAINGKFTINENGEQVYFSQGNLQYKASLNTWRFAENQWNIVGGIYEGYEFGNVYENGVKCDNSQISQVYAGWIDLFGWGTSGYHDNDDPYNTNYQPYSTSNSVVNETYNKYGYGPSTNMSNPDITGSNYDWGVYNKISNGGNRVGLWRTLTSSEWLFVFQKRETQTNILFVKANVNGVNGYILLPDDWRADNYVLNNVNSSTADYETNVITEVQWCIFEQYGAVFLPIAGTRKGIVLNNGSSRGGYWSSTHSNVNSALSSIDTYCGNRARSLGESVRLVCPVE